MNHITRDVKSGRVKIIIYTKSDLNKSRMLRPVLKDLINNVPNFSTKIAWILKVIPQSGHTMNEVIKDYLNEFAGDKTLFLTQAGTLSPVTAYEYEDKNLSDNIIMLEFNDLIDCGFNGIVWNRCMGKSYGNTSICIYMNDGGKSFIEKYTSPDSIIARTISEPLKTPTTPEST